ncbi:hypothetical protein SCHPADRAFT_482644 [Schizopora paradoxa]|uniref:Uncharacterized protein n=1 Tax=Schizopora paradoxa TaxID=27342 RepID=A0A0H2RP12_9AGAM|nr:hypothetical protein SCHPADRAFT_482644 [Schizopora paradoxa]
MIIEITITKCIRRVSKSALSTEQSDSYATGGDITPANVRREKAYTVHCQKHADLPFLRAPNVHDP